MPPHHRLIRGRRIRRENPHPHGRSRIIDHRNQHRPFSPPLKPIVKRRVHLYQLPEAPSALSPLSVLDLSLPPVPNTPLHHPLSQRLSADFQTPLLRQIFRSQRRPKSRIPPLKLFHRFL